jgi:hypothetical protein
MKYVLFVCTHNAGRSQMAQSLVERYAPDDVRAESAGSDPARGVADWGVTMGCGDVCPYVPTTVDDWDIPDPAGRSIDEVREIRDMIDERVRELATDKIAAIRSDATSHRWRLAKLLPQLIAEFDDTRSPELIRGCADRVLNQYDEVPIRSHILSLAHKQTRECLRGERCALL